MWMALELKWMLLNRNPTVAFASIITCYSMLLQLLSEDAGFHSPGSGTRLGIIQHCRSIADEGSVDDLR